MADEIQIGDFVSFVSHADGKTVCKGRVQEREWLGDHYAVMVKVAGSGTAVVRASECTKLARKGGA